MPPKQVDISALEPRQLQGIQESLQNEINNLANSSMALQKAAGEYGNSGRALEQLAEQQTGTAQPVYTCSAESEVFLTMPHTVGQPMLLPITSAVYVSGNLESNDKILLDIGTGYFAEVHALHPMPVTRLPCCTATIRYILP